jgi:hypothetical protein
MAVRSHNPRKFMENISEFNLNSALQLWLERLGQSPQVKAENLKELESHVRDSVVQLQGKGLSSEESFLVATHRVGSPAKLEPEFAKVNRSPLNKIMHGLILVFFSVGCWFLWAMLQFPHRMVWANGMNMPAFTRLVMSFGSSFLAVPPLLAAVYCVFVWVRRPNGRSSWVGFLATSMAVLILITLPTLIALLLPMIAFMNQHLAK